jgi:chromate reductase
MTRFDLAPIPMYNHDVEVAGLPAAVVAFKDAIETTDGVFITCPEYNHSMSALMKNALDWQSRPRGQASITGKPIAIATVSNGPTGGVRAQGELKRVLLANFAHVFPFPEFALPRGSQAFTEDGTLIDEFALDQLPKMLDGFAEFIRTLG